MEVNGHFFGECSLTLVLHDEDPRAVERSAAEAIKVLASHDGTSLLSVVSEFGFAMGVGVALGFLGARLLAPLACHAKLSSDELRPVLLVALAIVLYAVQSASNTKNAGSRKSDIDGLRAAAQALRTSTTR